MAETAPNGKAIIQIRDLRKARGKKTRGTRPAEEIDNGQECRIERCAKGGGNAAHRIVSFDGVKVKVYVGCELVQIRLRIPAISIPRCQAAREHVVLEHVVEADAKSARQKYGNQSQDQANDIYFGSEGA